MPYLYQIKVALKLLFLFNFRKYSQLSCGYPQLSCKYFVNILPVSQKMSDIKQRKIIIFSTAYFPFIGGAEVAVKEITDRIDGIQFDLITAKMDGKLAKCEQVGNVNVYRVGFGCKADKFFLPFLGWLKALSLNKKNKYDIAWSIMASQASIAAAFFKIFNPRVKLILTLQEGDEEEHLKRYALNCDFLYKILIRPWHLLVFKKADGATAISEYLRQRILKSGFKGEVELVPNGVEIKKFQISNDKFQINSKFPILNIKKKLGISENEKIIITTSRLVEKNGVGYLIEAVNILVNQKKLSVKLLICGDGELREELELRVAGYKLRDKVLFLGSVKNEEVPQYLAIADVFCRPSLSEGLGNSFLEAMAAGVPVVATPVGGILDFLSDGQTGWFCEVKNPESIAEKIRYILNEENEEEVKRVVANARNMVEEKYGWEGIAEKMEKVFSSAQ